MYFSQKLYVGNDVENLPQIKKNLLNNTGVSGIFLICTDNNNKNIAEILSCKEFFSAFNREKNYTIIGISKGKKEAFTLFEEIMRDFIGSENNLDEFKDYFK